MRILIIDFSEGVSDEGDRGLGGKVERALSNVKENDVALVQMVEPSDAPDDLHGIDWKSRFDQNAFDAQGGAFDKVILCAHGLFSDTSNIYTELYGHNHRPTNLMGHALLADFMYYVLSTPIINTDVLPLELISSICYSARSDDAEADHIEDYEDIDFTTSLAYKFYDNLVKCYEEHNERVRVELYAYTGEVSFHEVTGQVVVETEEQIRLAPLYRQKYREFQEISNQCGEYEEEQNQLKEQLKELKDFAVETDHEDRAAIEKLQAVIDSKEEMIEDFYNREVKPVYEEANALENFLKRRPVEYGRVEFRVVNNYDIIVDTSKLAEHLKSVDKPAEISYDSANCCPVLSLS